MTVDQIPSHSHWIPAINWEAPSCSNTPVAGTTYHKDGATQLSSYTGGGKGHNHKYQHRSTKYGHGKESLN